MLTLLIQLKNASDWSRVCEMVIEAFPGEIVLHSADPKEGLRLKLNQVVMTDGQRDWLHLSALGMWYIDEYQVIEPENDVEKLAKENERLTTENRIMRRELKMVAEDLREIVDIHGDHDMTSTPTEKLSRMASGIEGMFKKEVAK